MPNTIVLLSNGTFDNVLVPGTAQEICSLWRHESLFPNGVYLHKMTHLSKDLTWRLQEMLGSKPENIILSISLLLDRRNKNGGFMLQPNYHEIPRMLETQLLFGNLMCIMTIDGCRVVNMTERMLKHILNLEVTNITTPLNSPVHKSYTNFMSTPKSSMFENDDGECCPMDMSPDYVEMADYSFSPKMPPPILKKKITKKKNLKKNNFFNFSPSVRSLF